MFVFCFGDFILFYYFHFLFFFSLPLSCSWTFCTENPGIWALFIKPRWDCDSQAWKGGLMFKETIQRIYFLLKKKPVDLNIWSVSLFLSWLFFSLFFFFFVLFRDGWGVVWILFVVIAGDSCLFLMGKTSSLYSYFLFVFSRLKHLCLKVKRKIILRNWFQK